MEKTIDFNIVADLCDSYVQTDFDIAFYIELKSISADDNIIVIELLGK